MGSRSKAYDQDPGLGVAKTWDWTAPVFPIAVSEPLYFGDVLPVSDESRAAGAGDDLCLQNSELRYGFFLVNSSSMSDT